ncbi:MAG: hypothetical protein QW491_13945 [Thermoproteota archaeon]
MNAINDVNYEITRKNLEYYNEWLEFAEVDLISATRLYKAGQKSEKGHIFYRYSLYHIQQASEKIGKVYLWLVATKLLFVPGFIGAGAAQKYRKTVNLLKRIASARGKNLGHGPISGFKDINKFLRLYKEGEACRLILEFIDSVEKFILQKAKIPPNSEQERAFKERFEVLRGFLKKHREGIKIVEIEKGRPYGLPNFEKLQIGLGNCDEIDSIFKKISQSLAEFRINDFAPNLKPIIEAFGIKVNVKKLRDVFENWKEFFTFLMSSLKEFVVLTTLWSLLAPFVEARYPDQRIDNRTFELIPELHKRLKQALSSAEEFNVFLLEMLPKIQSSEKSTAG